MNAMYLKWCICITVLFSLRNQAHAQYTFFNPEGSFAIEVSLSNSDLVRLPIDRNAITSLISKGDLIVGGTSAKNGQSPFIFIASISKKQLLRYKDISEIVPGQKAFKSGFVRGSNGALYIGTLPQNTFDQCSGHLLSVNIDPNNEIIVKDLGIPVPKEGIFALTGNPAENMIYGLTYPSGYLFSYNTNSRKTKIFRETAPTQKSTRELQHQFALTPEDYLSKELIMDDSGMIYGSLPYGKIFIFNTQSESVSIMEETLPDVWGREAMAQIDSWIKGKNGRLYGANSADGQLFELDTETKKIKNLGKPIMMSRLPDMVLGADGKIYGLAGGAPGYSHLFSYEPMNGFKDYGNPEFEMKAPGIEQGINWRGFQLSTITSSEDGKYIIMGENESLSQLMVFPVATE